MSECNSVLHLLPPSCLTGLGSLHHELLLLEALHQMLQILLAFQRCPELIKLNDPLIFSFYIVVCLL